MNNEKQDKDQPEINPDSEKRDKMTEELLNEIELESRAEAGDTISDENKNDEEEGLLSKIGIGKKDKHKKEIKELHEKIHELNDRYLRIVAEFDNFKKRNVKERVDLIRTAGQDVISTLLPVLDDFQRALKQMEQAKDVDAVKEGVNLIFTKLNSTLESRGLRVMISMGESFNPDLHDAISEVPSPDENMIGKVVDEIEQGYYLNDKIIRHAKVIVGK